MTKTFNLKQYMTKTAYYDDGKGSMVSQTRSFQNCYKQQCDKKKGPQDAWNTCLEEYQKSGDKDKWVLNYSGAKDEGTKIQFDAKTPAAKKLDK
jgi:hypothetical protein